MACFKRIFSRTAKRKKKDYPNIILRKSEIEYKVNEEKFNMSLAKIGDCLESSTFPCDPDAPFNWKIKFFPLGRKGYSEYSSISLILICRKVKMPIATVIRLAIKTERNITLVSKEFEHIYKKVQGWGFPKFCETANLRPFLSRGSLIICAEVRAFYDANAYRTNTFTCVQGLLQDYSNLLKSGIFSDVVLCATQDGTEFKVHRSILASRSRVFSAMLTSNMKEKQTDRIEIIDLSSISISSMLDFIYSCEVYFKNEIHALELLEASEKYDLMDLKLQCAEYLSTIIDRNNFGNILLYAHQYNLLNLKSSILKYICKHKDKLSDTKQYRALLEKNADILLDALSEVYNLL